MKQKIDTIEPIKILKIWIAILTTIVLTVAVIKEVLGGDNIFAVLSMNLMLVSFVFWVISLIKKYRKRSPFIIKGFIIKPLFLGLFTLILLIIGLTITGDTDNKPACLLPKVGKYCVV